MKASKHNVAMRLKKWRASAPGQVARHAHFLLVSAAAAFFLPGAGAASAQSVTALEDLDALDARIADVTGALIGENGGASSKLDARLRLIRCPQRAVIEVAQPDVISVRCPSIGWRVRVLRVAPSSQKAGNAAAPVVLRGDAIDLIYEGQGFAATASGTAMDSGAVGESIRVKSLTSAAPLTARVSGPGEARIAH